MKKISRSRLVSVVVAALMLLMGVAFVFLGESGVEVLDTDVLSWADAAKKCKAKYRTLRSPGLVLVSNSKKRTWDDDYFYFYWKKPLSIYIKKSNGEKTAYPATCQVSRKSGDIVYMTLGKKELVSKTGK